MNRYLVLLQFTQTGAASVKASVDRAAAFRKRAESVGAKVEDQFWTLGSYDGAFVLTAPDETTAAALVLDLSHQANVKTTMLRAFDAGEFQKIAGKLG